MDTAEVALFGFGYPAAVSVIARFAGVVRERRWRLLLLHHLGMAAIVGAFASKRIGGAAAVNGAWLVASTVWYVLGGRRRAAPAGG